MLSSHRSAFLDESCRLFTYVGAWIPYIIVICMLLWRFSASISLLFNLLTTSIVVQIIKPLVAAPRPLAWFATNMPEMRLDLVEGVSMNMHNSFPSGHTTTFFIFFITLCIIYDHHKKQQNVTKDVMIGVIAFIMATYGAYTRIYLHQHFTLDIFAGISIALLCSIRGSRIYAWLCSKLGESNLISISKKKE